MIIAVSQAITLEAFLTLPETKPASEYIDGEVIQKPMPKGRHSRLQGKLGAAINQVTEDAQIAYAFPGLRCTFSNRSIVPDLSVFQWQQIPFSSGGEVPDNFELPPTWALEILSPEQKPHKVIANLLHCLEFGCQLGWFLDPDDRSILLFQPNQQPKLLQGNDRLPVPTWLALELTANQVFGWLQMAAE